MRHLKYTLNSPSKIFTAYPEFQHKVHWLCFVLVNLPVSIPDYSSAHDCPSGSEETNAVKMYYINQPKYVLSMTSESSGQGAQPMRDDVTM